MRLLAVRLRLVSEFPESQICALRLNSTRPCRASCCVCDWLHFALHSFALLLKRELHACRPAQRSPTRCFLSTLSLARRSPESTREQHPLINLTLRADNQSLYDQSGMDNRRGPPPRRANSPGGYQVSPRANSPGYNQVPPRANSPGGYQMDQFGHQNPSLGYHREGTPSDSLNMNAAVSSRPSALDYLIIPAMLTQIPAIH